MKLINKYHTYIYIYIYINIYIANKLNLNVYKKIR